MEANVLNQFIYLVDNIAQKSEIIKYTYVL